MVKGSALPSGLSFPDGRADWSTGEVWIGRREVLLKMRLLGALLATQGSFDQGPRGIGLIVCFRVIFQDGEAVITLRCP